MARKRSTTLKAKSPRKGGDKSPTVAPVNDDAKRELFLHHREGWNAWRAKQKAIEKIGDDLKKSLKADGFLVKEFTIADELLTQRGEIKIKGEVTTRLRVARWLGHPMGNQLDLFAETSNAAADPFELGKQASMENQARKVPPQYAEFSDAYELWMKGYSEHQTTLAAKFKRPEPEVLAVDRTPPSIGDEPPTFVQQ